MQQWFLKLLALQLAGTIVNQPPNYCKHRQGNTNSIHNGLLSHFNLSGSMHRLPRWLHCYVICAQEQCAVAFAYAFLKFNWYSTWNLLWSHLHQLRELWFCIFFQWLSFIMRSNKQALFIELFICFETRWAISGVLSICLYQQDLYHDIDHCDSIFSPSSLHTKATVFFIPFHDCILVNILLSSQN